MNVWREHVLLGDVWHNDCLTFIELRDAIVERLRASRWFKTADQFEFNGVHEIIDSHLAAAEDPEEFDGWWSEMYDHADRDRVWIDLYKSPVRVGAGSPSRSGTPDATTPEPSNDGLGRAAGQPPPG